MGIAVFGGLLASAATAHATVVSAGADGVLTIANETSVASGGSGMSAIILHHGSGVPDPDSLVISVGGPLTVPLEQVEKLTLDPASAPWCSAQLSGPFVVSVVCQSAAIERIDISTGDGDDFVSEQAVTRVGDRTTSDPSDDPAFRVSLGAGDDAWHGSQFSEVVRDGLGSDGIYGYTPWESGNDLFVQPDTPAPALDDHGDTIDSSYTAGVVSYGERTGQGVIVFNRDWLPNDGADGEDDDIHTFGVVGTSLDDVLSGEQLNGGAGDDVLHGIGFEDGPVALHGEQGDDDLFGGEGSDELSGGDGADRIVSDIGLDEISGGDGDDTIGADDGDPDSVACGAGADAVTADPPTIDASFDGCESITRFVAEPVTTVIDSAPPAATNDTTPTVAFSSNYPTAKFECALDGSPYVQCWSPVTADPLPDGTHTLLVRARRGTRIDETPAVVTTRVDTVAPQTEVTAPDTAHDDLDLELGSDESGVRYDCSLDGGGWSVCQQSLDVSALAAGAHVLAVRAIDAATNVDASPATRDFTIVNDVPALAPTASPSSGPWDLDVQLALGAQDPDGDSLTYHVEFGDGSGAMTGSVGSQPIAHTYTEPGVYVISAVVSDGRAEASATTTVTVTQPEPLDAAAGDDVVATSGAAVTFDAGASRPPAGIETYSWDFGDGQAASGARVVHAYVAPGTYTATLTIRRRAEVDTDTRVVTVRAPEPTGLDVNVRGDGAPLSDASVVVYDPEGRAYPAVTGPQGTARIGALADGEHRVLAYAPGFVPRAVTATTANGTGTVTIDLQTGELASAELSSRPLTLQEILDLGIDPDAPENQTVYDFTLNIAGVPALSGAANRTGFAGTAGGGWDCDADECTSAPPGCDCRLHVRTKDGALTTLVVPARASTLKEFFDVRMLVSNLAPPEFSFAGGAATLALPPGLSLAPTSVPQAPTRALGTIPGGQSREAQWVVRGDADGSYDLEAAFGAILEPFGRPVGVTAKTRTPLRVWGASALRVRIAADDELAAGHPYTVRVGLENVADVPLYDAAVSLADTGAHGYIRQPRQRRAYEVTTLAPGDTFWAGPYVLVPKESGAVSLAESFVESMRGDGAPQATISTHPRTPALTDTPRLTAARRTDTSLTLDWEPVPGATDYAIFRTADRDTEFPAVPLGPAVVKPIPGTSTRVVVTDAQYPQAGSARQYAVSALIGGVWTMVHPLAGEHLPAAESSPDVDIAYADRCGGDGILLELGLRSQDVPLARWEWRPDNTGAWILGGTLTEAAHKVTTMLSRPPAGAASISVRVTDTLGGTSTASSLIGTCHHNDPRNVPEGVDGDTPWWDFPDLDGDGLPDHWERDGVWVGTKRVDLAALGADPVHKDAFVYVDRLEGERWNDRIEGIVADSFRSSPLAISMHFLRSPRVLRRDEVPGDVDATEAFFDVTNRLGYMDSGLGGAPGSVPPLAKYVCVCPDHVDGRGTAGEAMELKGAHLVLTPHESYVIDALIARYNGGQWPSAYATSDEFIKDRFNASTLMHELGHLYGLHHRGTQCCEPDDPDYKSIMSYRYTTFGVPHREGAATRYSIDYSRESTVNLDWRLGGEIGALSLIGGQHGERGDFYLQVGEFPTGLEQLSDEAAFDTLLADPELADAMVEALVTTAEEGRQDPPGTPSTPADSQAGHAGPPPTGGQTTPAKTTVRVSRRVTRRGLRKGLRVRIEGSRAKTAVTMSLLRNGRRIATRRGMSDAAGRTNVNLRVPKAALRSLRRTRKLQLRVAYRNTLGTAEQVVVQLRLTA